MALCQSGIPVDEALAHLASAHHRRVLRRLLNDDGPVELADLAADLASLQGDDIESFETRLVHNHLPRLANAGVIEYDDEAGTVAPTETADELKPLLDFIAAWDRDRGT